MFVSRETLIINITLFVTTRFDTVSRNFQINILQNVFSWKTNSKSVDLEMMWKRVETRRHYIYSGIQINNGIYLRNIKVLIS